MIIKNTDMLFNLKEIKEAVDFATGDDGFRSNEVVEILKQTREMELLETQKQFKDWDTSGKDYSTEIKDRIDWQIMNYNKGDSDGK